MRLLIVSCFAVVALISQAAAEEVGEFRNDWTGNSIVVEAVPDPKVAGGELPHQPVQPRPDRQTGKGKLVRRSVKLVNSLPTDWADHGRRHQHQRQRRRSVFPTAQPDFQVAGGAPHLRQKG